MTDLILINPSYFTPGQSERRREQYSGFIRGGNMYFHPFEPPLGLASLAAYLALKGYSCELVDMPGDEIDDEGLRERLRLSQPRLIGITAMTPTERRALEIAELCKSLLPEAPVVLGGVAPSVKPEEALLSSAVDFVVRGEGEEVMAALMASDLNDCPPEMPGLCFCLPDGGVHVEEKAVLIPDLDVLPLPDYTSFAAEAYVQYTEELRGIRGISMLVSRGCPYPCSFCAVHQTMGRHWRGKSPSLVSQEMDEVCRLLNLDGIWFKDSIFNLNHRWVHRFCECRKTSPTICKFQINSRVDLICEDELAMMAESGLIQIDLGIESGSPQTLKTLQKGISPEQVRKVVRMAKRYVRVAGFFMIGVPGETEEDIDMTIHLAHELELDAASISIFTPLPGSALYDSLMAQGRLQGQEYEIHFTEAAESYCNVPIERLRERFMEFNENFVRPRP